MISIPRSEWGSQLQWAVSAPLLALHLAGQPAALVAVLSLCALSVLHYAVALRSWRPYRVQVRLGFLAVVALALAPGLSWLAWIPLVGTSAQLLFGYCPMARCLDLLPWNRSEPLTLGLVWRTITRPPGGEGLLSRRAGRRDQFATVIAGGFQLPSPGGKASGFGQ